MQVILSTVNDVIDALGGVAAMRDRYGIRSAQVVSNWRTRGNFPPAMHHAMTADLAARGLDADPRLWGQVVIGAAA